MGGNGGVRRRGRGWGSGGEGTEWTTRECLRTSTVGGVTIVMKETGVAFGGGGAAAQATVAKRCPGPEPEKTAARRRRCGGGSSLLAGVEEVVRVREKLAVWKTDGPGNFGISGHFRI